MCSRLNFFWRKGKIFLPLQHRRPNGGIGRRDGLKHRWGNPSRFEPGFGHIQQAIISVVCCFFLCICLLCRVNKLNLRKMQKFGYLYLHL